MKRRSISLKEISAILGIELVGKNLTINALGNIDYSSVHNSVLSYAFDSNYIKKIKPPKHIKAIITKSSMYNEFFKSSEISCLISVDPASDFFYLHNFLASETDFYSYDFLPVKVGLNCEIHGSTILFDNVIIGNNTTIHPNVVLYPQTIIGNNVTIRANTVIGSEGNNFRIIKGIRTDLKHVGGVKIGNNVTIGASCTIDANLYEDYSLIGNNVRIGQQTHIAPVCNIEDNVTIGGNSFIFGSVTIKNKSYLAPGVNIRNKIIIGSNSIIGMGSNVIRNIPENEIWAGNPAKKLRDNTI